METCLASFVSSFLQCVLGDPPSQAQLDLFLAVARRGEGLGQGSKGLIGQVL